MLHEYAYFELPNGFRIWVKNRDAGCDRIKVSFSHREIDHNEILSMNARYCNLAGCSLDDCNGSDFFGLLQWLSVLEG